MRFPSTAMSARVSRVHGNSHHLKFVVQEQVNCPGWHYSGVGVGGQLGVHGLTIDSVHSGGWCRSIIHPNRSLIVGVSSRHRSMVVAASEEIALVITGPTPHH